MRKAAVVFLVAALLQSQSANASEKTYRPVLENEIEITVPALNVRIGPGPEYMAIDAVKQGDKLKVIGAIGNWYVVHLSSGSIGLIANEYTKVLKISDIYIAEGSDLDQDKPDTEPGILFGLANQLRANNGIKRFVWDEKLNRIAQLKAEDMQRNNYIGHYSPNYKTPFEMLKQMGIVYKSASQNITTNVSVESGFAVMVSTPSQRINLLNTRYNKMGVGVIDSKDYGKIMVQMFVEDY